MSLRIAKLEALLGRVQRRMSEPRAVDSVAPTQTFRPGPGPQDAVVTNDAVEAGSSDDDEPLSLDSPSIIPPSDEPDSLDGPELVASLSPERASAPVVDLDEQVPESGPVVSTLEQALSQAAEGPITPPPESVEEPIVSPPRPSRPFGTPTLEQLGETVDLDEGDVNSTLELDEPIIEDLPASLAPPVAPRSVAPGFVAAGFVAAVPSAPLVAAAEPFASLTGEPVVAQRPTVSAAVIDLKSAAKTPAASSFLELLDASLNLK